MYGLLLKKDVSVAFEARKRIRSLMRIRKFWKELILYVLRKLAGTESYLKGLFFLEKLMLIISYECKLFDMPEQLYVLFSCPCLVGLARLACKY